MGYFFANVWFYGLGALILLAAGVTQEPKGFVEAIALIAGPLALLVLLVDETDEAWADLYSCAVSLTNIFPAVNQRGLLVGLGMLSFAVALLLDITQYEGFLLLIGSVFVPLFGVLASDYFAVRRRYEVDQLFRVRGAYWYWNGFHWPGLLAWAVGVGVYLWIAGRLSWLGLSGLPWLGASVPSFLLAFGVYWALSQGAARRAVVVSRR